MTSRDQILAKVKQNQPQSVSLPDLSILGKESFDSVTKFVETAVAIGAEVIEIQDFSEIQTYINSKYSGKTIRSTLADFNSENWLALSPKELDGTDFLLIKARFGVAENGSIWIADKDLGQRIAPFITEYLGVILDKSKIINTMHQAYQIIGDEDYGFGLFLAGPSKTADIEQSLVLGAHGARGLVIFLF
ncbi:MAG: LUD domain-containing protein [Spirosomataceae bacterium]|jgi:L-lactate dehydrogenase complex protein LldG